MSKDARDHRGSDEASPRPRRPANWGNQPLGLWWVLPIGLTIAIVVLFQAGVRPAGYTMAGTLVVAAIARLVLPREAVGGLLVRSRSWDALTLVVLAVAVTVISATLVIP
ncbi:DUF3017 domain-containing protein [Ornithinimicrobium cryptoxanthini]|uniref:DUF3017 domain-containing protein n=1 Tax=Ornithinimicrobium cryptoxanthini TaxID=2934161 RepID=A0ABY4YKW4_9MICO|nr:DUF3017 domain-containing protein [Ornithinimicrobium cryptoxanthini]USQ77196.1 DUF3017 domain-containing protein [Ornithinimicrobium cryptoxanthini]